MNKVFYLINKIKVKIKGGNSSFKDFEFRFEDGSYIKARIRSEKLTQVMEVLTDIIGE